MTMDSGQHEASASSADLGPSAARSPAPPVPSASSVSSVQRWYAVRRQLEEVGESGAEPTVDVGGPDEPDERVEDARHGDPSAGPDAATVQPSPNLEAPSIPLDP